jgi:hypothetical protein
MPNAQVANGTSHLACRKVKKPEIRADFLLELIDRKLANGPVTLLTPDLQLGVVNGSLRIYEYQYNRGG